ncbi:MAG: porin [Clostridiales bacterium]|nr:porin [Clostridiales bacterium]
MRKTLLIATAMTTMLSLHVQAADTTAASESESEQYTSTGKPTQSTEQPEMSTLPGHMVVLGSNNNRLRTTVLNALLDTRDLHFQDPGVPRYLLIDKEGKSVLGIGGYVEGVATADFRGSIPSYGFVTYDIPVPSTPGSNRRLGADVSHTTIFLKLVRHTSLGILNAYVQTNFTGDDNNYGLKLEQAYISLGNVTMGLANSTFADPSAGVPTIDYQGPSGQIGAKNILLRYRYDFASGFTIAASAELPKVTISPLDDKQEYIQQSLPDIPAYIQYSWGHNSHIRASGILRNMSYRDLVDGSNRHKVGYGAQISGITEVTRLANIYYQGAYGRGIAHYVNDLDGTGMDLVASGSHPGEMIAPRTLSIVAGAQFNISPKIFISAAYSMNRLYDQAQLGPDTYRRGNYVVANMFYTPIADLQFGLEYLHGTRSNVDGSNNRANRLEIMAKYSF